MSLFGWLDSLVTQARHLPNVPLARLAGNAPPSLLAKPGLNKATGPNPLTLSWWSTATLPPAVTAAAVTVTISLMPVPLESGTTGAPIQPPWSIRVRVGNIDYASSKPLYIKRGDVSIKGSKKNINHAISVPFYPCPYDVAAVSSQYVAFIVVKAF